MTEHAIQNAIRNDLAGDCLCFRANVGQAWAGSRVERLSGGRVLIHDARPFSTGLPPGFPDLFGLVTETITPEMVGQDVAVFFGVEVKTAKGRASEKQLRGLETINRMGGRAGIARSPEDARRIVKP